MKSKRTSNLIDKWRKLLERDPTIKERYEEFVNDFENLMKDYEEAME